MRKPIIKIKLRRSNDGYVLEQLQNAAVIGVDPRRTTTTQLRVGDKVSELQAQTLCEVNNYDVTINNA